MKNLIKFSIYLFLVLMFFLIIWIFLIHPIQINTLKNNYHSLYDKYLDNIEFTLQRNPVSELDLVAYFKDTPEIHQQIVTTALDEHIKHGHETIHIRYINEFILSSYVFESFNKAISDILNNSEINYLIHLQFIDQSNSGIEIAQVNRITEYMNRTSFKGNLEIRILLDKNQKDLYSVNILDLHKKLTEFSKTYFMKYGKINMNIYFATAYSSTFEYYDNHRYHIEDAFLGGDVEIHDSAIRLHEKDILDFHQ